MLLIILLNIVPLLLLGLAWWFYRNEGASLTSWRRGVFLSAFVANAVSAAVLLSFIAQAYIASKGTKPVDLDRAYPVFSMLGVGLLAAILARLWKTCLSVGAHRRWAFNRRPLVSSCNGCECLIL